MDYQTTKAGGKSKQVLLRNENGMGRACIVSCYLRPNAVIFVLTARVRVNEKRELTTMLNEPGHHGIKIVYRDKDAPFADRKRAQRVVCNIVVVNHTKLSVVVSSAGFNICPGTLRIQTPKWQEMIQRLVSKLRNCLNFIIVRKHVCYVDVIRQHCRVLAVYVRL